MYLDQQPGACVLDEISMIQERHEKRRDIEVDEVKGIAKERVNL
jgi:predicted transposase YbfD/YdcC